MGKKHFPFHTHYLLYYNNIFIFMNNITKIFTYLDPASSKKLLAYFHTMSELQRVLARRRTLNGESSTLVKEILHEHSTVEPIAVDNSVNEDCISQPSSAEVETLPPLIQHQYTAAMSNQKMSKFRTQQKALVREENDIVLDDDVGPPEIPQTNEIVGTIRQTTVELLQDLAEDQDLGTPQNVDKSHAEVPSAIPKDAESERHSNGDFDDFLGSLNEDLNAIFNDNDGEVDLLAVNVPSRGRAVEHHSVEFGSTDAFDAVDTHPSAAHDVGYAIDISTSNGRGSYIPYRGTLFDNDDEYGQLDPLAIAASSPPTSSVGGRRRFSSLGSSRRLSGGSNFDSSPEHMQSMFHELVEDTMIGSSGLDLTLNDSGFVDGQDGLQALESLMGAAPKIGANYSYAPAGSLSEEHLGAETDLLKPIHDRKKRISADEVDANIDIELQRNLRIGSPDSESSVFTEVLSPVKRPVVLSPSSLEMDYDDFAHRMLLPQCEDLRSVISRFIWSIIGPSGDGKPPNTFQEMPPGCAFVGVQDLDRRCSDFFSAMDGHFRSHPRWKEESDEIFTSVRDCLEQQCMQKIAGLAYNYTASSCATEDAIIFRKICCLQFLKPAHFDIAPPLQNEQIWAIAGAELAKISHAITPAAKNACVVKCSAVIFRAMSLISKQLSGGKDDGSSCGADEFLPLFIWVVLRAKVPRLLIDCEYIEMFLNPERLMGKDGYCLMNLRSALMFIGEITSKSVTMDPNDFDAGCEAFEASYSLEV